MLSGDAQSLEGSSGGSASPGAVFLEGPGFCPLKVGGGGGGGRAQEARVKGAPTPHPTFPSQLGPQSFTFLGCFSASKVAVTSGWLSYGVCSLGLVMPLLGPTLQRVQHENGSRR